MTLANSFPMEFDVTFNQNELHGVSVDPDQSNGSLIRERLLISSSGDVDTASGNLATGRLLIGNGVDIDSGDGILSRSRDLRSGPIPVPNDFPMDFDVTFEDNQRSKDDELATGGLTRERALVGDAIDIDVGDGEVTRIRTLIGTGTDPDSGSGELVVISERLRGESVATGERQIISVAQGSID